MAVLLTDGLYQVRKRQHPAERDAHGTPIPTADDAVTDLVDGAAVQQPDGTWKLRLDPAVWPVRSGNTVEKPTDDRKWTVAGVSRLHQVPGAPDVDFVDVQAVAVPPEADRGYPVPTPEGPRAGRRGDGRPAGAGHHRPGRRRGQGQRPADQDLAQQRRRPGPARAPGRRRAGGAREPAVRPRQPRLRPGALRAPARQQLRHPRDRDATPGLTEQCRCTETEDPQGIARGIEAHPVEVRGAVVVGHVTSVGPRVVDAEFGTDQDDAARYMGRAVQDVAARLRAQ